MRALVIHWAMVGTAGYLCVAVPTIGVIVVCIAAAMLWKAPETFALLSLWIFTGPMLRVRQAPDVDAIEYVKNLDCDELTADDDKIKYLETLTDDHKELRKRSTKSVAMAELASYDDEEPF